MKFEPCKRRWAIQALLSLTAETWQSLHCFVSVARTVCGTNVLKAAGETGRRDCLLRVVEPVAIRILRTHEDGAGGTRGSDAVAGDSAVDAEHVDVVAKDLKVVTGVIARGEAFVVKHGLARVSCHLQMTAEAGGRPGGVAGIASHGGIGVGEVLVVLWHL